MKRTFILSICLVGWFMAHSQSVQTAFTQPYFYEEFREGQVFFSEGNPVKVKLNYSFVLEEMEFLDHQNNNQILTMVRKPNMTHIEIGNDVFVPVDRQGWAVVIQSGPIVLLEKRHFIPRNKTGAYGVELTTSGAQNISNMELVVDAASSAGSSPVMSAPTGSGQVVTTSNVGIGSDAGGIGGGSNPHRTFATDNFKVEPRFYLMKDRVIYPATRRNFLRLYSSVGRQLEQFIRENRVNFNNEAHLRGLTRYANSLLMENMARSQ